MHVCNARECKQTQTQSILTCVVLCCGCVELPYYGDIATAEEEQVFVWTSEFRSNYVRSSLSSITYLLCTKQPALIQH